MLALIQSEARKILTTPRWWLLGIGMLLSSAALAALLTFVGLNSSRSPLEMSTAQDIGAIVNVAASMTFVFSIILGVIIVTAEYTDGTLAQTLLAGRKPGRVYLAKAAAGIGFGLLLAAATILVCLGIVSLLLTAQGASVPWADPELTRRLAGGTMVLGLWTVIGVGLGALIRNQLVAVVGIVVFTLGLEPMLRIAVPQISTYLPGSVAEMASGGSLMALALGTAGMSQLAALAAMTLGALAILWIGGWRFVTAEP